MKLTGATGNNFEKRIHWSCLWENDLRNGVSGSGKSTLINGTLYPILNAYYFNGKNRNLTKK
jgi:excinuclease ABC subunit A